MIQMLSRFFPPPQFLTLPSAGVDISDGSLKYIQFGKHSRELSLLAWGDLTIPENTVKRGSLANPDALVEVLKELRTRISTDFIRVSLPEERAYLFETTLEHVGSYKDIRNMIEFRLAENVPIPPRDAYFDFAIVGTNPTSGEVRVAVAVYAQETITGYYDACKRAGFVPLSFEVEAQAIARAVVPRTHQGTAMIVDFGQTRTGVGIVHKGTLMFTSTIDIGGAQMSDALRRVLGDMEEKECTRIKNEEGLLRSFEGTQVAAAILPSVAALKDELGMRINYWNLRVEDTKERAIERIILCGGSVNLAGLPEYLQDELEMPVERARVWQNALSFAEAVPPITRRYSYGYATAIGLALTEMYPHHD